MNIESLLGELSGPRLWPQAVDICPNRASGITTLPLFRSKTGASLPDYRDREGPPPPAPNPQGSGVISMLALLISSAYAVRSVSDIEK